MGGVFLRDGLLFRRARLMSQHLSRQERLANAGSKCSSFGSPAIQFQLAKGAERILINRKRSFEK